jgi:hypothetical protein
MTVQTVLICINRRGLGYAGRCARGLLCLAEGKVFLPY